MSNGEQMQHAIDAAIEEIAGEGWRDADLRVVMLAGFGYLSGRIEKSRPLHGKRLLAGVGGIGGVLGAFLDRLISFV